MTPHLNNNQQKLKFYGVEDVKIKKAINDLFHKNIRIDE